LIVGGESICFDEVLGLRHIKMSSIGKLVPPSEDWSSSSFLLSPNSHCYSF
jgi:hypothetical protein